MKFKYILLLCGKVTEHKRKIYENSLEIMIMKFHIEKNSIKIVYEPISLTSELIKYSLYIAIIHIKTIISLLNSK